jgi:mannose-6-phosphate isomerase
MAIEAGETSGAFEPTRVEKPWGHELIWAHTDGYVGKILHVRAGHALSLQYHQVKDETIHMLRGTMRFWVGPDTESLAEVELVEGASYRIRPGTVHRMQAVTDVDILEASTPHLQDVVRLEDRYGRT